jgi:hypothetical protein
MSERGLVAESPTPKGARPKQIKKEKLKKKESFVG